jgi:histidine ammonia-lyase
MSSLVRDALAILLLALCQSLDLPKKAAPGVELGVLTGTIHQLARDQACFLEFDRFMHEEIECIRQMIQQQAFDVHSHSDQNGPLA